MKPGDIAYIVESNRNVRDVTIVKCSGGMYIIKFNDTGGGIQVKKHRIFASIEDAKKSIPGYEPPRRKTPYDYMQKA